MQKLLKKLPRVVHHIYTIFAFMMGWALFYFTDLTQLGGFFRNLFSLTPTSRENGHLILAFLPLMVVAIFASTPAAIRLKEKYAARPATKWLLLWGAVMVMALCVAALANQSYNPFIYFRF